MQYFHTPSNAESPIILSTQRQTSKASARQAGVLQNQDAICLHLSWITLPFIHDVTSNDKSLIDERGQ